MNKGVFLMFMVCLLSEGCMHESLDLSKDLNTDMSLNVGSLNLPFGSSDKITLSTIIDETPELTTTENGDYIFQSQAYLIKNSLKLDAGFKLELDRVVFPKKTISFNPNYSSEVGFGKLQSTFEFSRDLEINQKVPTEIVSLLKVKLSESSKSMLRLHLKLDAKDTFFKYVQDLKVSKLKVELPQFLSLHHQTSHVIEFDDVNLTSTGIELLLEIEALDFEAMSSVGLEMENSHLILDQFNRIHITGVIDLDTKLPAGVLLDDVILSSYMDIDPLEIGEVEGHFNPRIIPVSQAYDLDWGETFNDIRDDLTFTIANPKIAMDFNYPLGVPLLADIVIKSYVKGVSSQDTTKIVLNDVSIGATKADQKLLFVADTTGIVTDAVLIQKPELSKLLNGFNQEIQTDVFLDVDMSKPHHLDLSHSKDVDINTTFQLQASWVFTEMALNYSKEITHIDTELEGIADRLHVTDLQLRANYTSTVPLNAEVSALAYDTKGKIMRDVVIQPITLSGICKKKPISTQVYLPENRLPDLSTIVWSVNATVIPGKVLNKYMYFQLTDIMISLTHGGSYEVIKN